MDQLSLKTSDPPSSIRIYIECGIKRKIHLECVTESKMRALIVYYVGRDDADVRALSYFLEYGVRHNGPKKTDYTYVFVFNNSNGQAIETMVDKCDSLIGKTVSKCNVAISDWRDTLSGWHFGMMHVLTQPGTEQSRRDGDDIRIRFSTYDFYVFLSSFASGPFFPWWAYGSFYEDRNVIPDWCELYINLLTRKIANSLGNADCIVPTINKSGVISTELVVTRPETVEKWMIHKDILFTSNVSLSDNSVSLLQLSVKKEEQPDDMKRRWEFLSKITGNVKSMLMLYENGKSDIYNLAGYHPYETIFIQRLPLSGITPENILKINSIYEELYTIWHTKSLEWEGISNYDRNAPSKRTLILWTHHELNHRFQMFLNRGIIDDPNYTFVFIINLMGNEQSVRIKAQLESSKDLLKRFVHAKIHIIFYGPPVNGLDFGAWSYALLEWGPKNGIKWEDFEYIILLNGSVSGPHYPRWWYASLDEKGRSGCSIPGWITLFTSKVSDRSPFHMIGITANKNSVTRRGNRVPILQSMFICYRREALNDAIKSGIFLYPFPPKVKDHVVRDHERRMSHFLSTESPATSRYRITDMLVWTRYEQRLEPDPIKRKVRFTFGYHRATFTNGLRYLHPFETLFFKHRGDDNGIGGTSRLIWGY